VNWWLTFALALHRTFKALNVKPGPRDICDLGAQDEEWDLAWVSANRRSRSVCAPSRACSARWRFMSLGPAPRFVAGRGRRWITNALIVVLDSVAVRIVFPLATIGAALWADAQGLRPDESARNSLLWSGIIAGVLGYLLLDVIIWGQHVLSHKIPLFWRFHRMHHSDVDIDVTTALRFHPIEILASMALEDRSGVLAWHATPGCVYLRSRAQWHGDVQPCQCPHSRTDRSVLIALVSSSHPTCTGCIIRSCGTKQTQTMASACPGGTGSFDLCGAAPAMATPAWTSACPNISPKPDASWMVALAALHDAAPNAQPKTRSENQTDRPTNPAE
jgi:hypothetical protein